MATNNSVVNVGIKFNADTSNLERTLKQLSLLTTKDLLDLNKSLNIKEAEKSLKELKTSISALQQAYNSSMNNNLGTINLKKFNESLSTSKISTEKIAASFKTLGTNGDIALTSLVSNLSKVPQQTKESVKWIDKMAESLYNAMRYNISSAILNSFTGSFQSAVGYVEKLDKSLNDIRIVSGKTAKEMQTFAKYANQAAQAVGATTIDYTEASLIYYQQGLTEEEVLKRTDVTVKAANVLGSTTSEVSDYMTAIWNNFYDGSQSLEYYADVLTKLGAATASSSEEIAEGLSKFSAVADTVGLSYEYATASLATVTAETRESADTVGTAFKTIFSRLQGLSLGETLDDGTDLNKYSTALNTVGVSVKDASGNLRDLDDILDDLGSKWIDLSDAQKTALAQTVAGSRQYNTLVSLMNNWSEVQENVNLALESGGTLEKQNAIYLESYEAHQEAATAATQKFYKALMNEDVLIFFQDIKKVIGNLGAGLVDVFGGGVSSIIFGLSLLLDKVKGSIAEAITKLVVNTKQAKEEAKENEKAWENVKIILQEIIDTKAKLNENNTNGMSSYFEDLNNKIITARDSFSKLSNPSEEQTNKFNTILGDYAKDAENLANKLDIVNELFKKIGVNTVNYSYATDEKGNKKDLTIDQNWNQKQDEIIKKQKAFNNKIDIQNIPSYKGKNADEKSILRGSKSNLLESARNLKDFNLSEDQITVLDSMTENVKKVSKDFTSGSASADEFASALGDLKKVEENISKDFNGKFNTALAEIGKEINKTSDSATKMTDSINENRQKLDGYINSASIQTQIEDYVEIGSCMMKVYSSINMLSNGFKSLHSIWSGEGTFLEKITSSYTSIASIVGGLTVAYKALNSEKIKNIVASIENEKIKAKEAAANAAETAAKTGETGAEVTNTAAKGTNVIQTGLQIIASSLYTAALLVEKVAVDALTGAVNLLKAAWTASPIGVVILAIGALVGAVYLAVEAYNKWYSEEAKLNQAIEETSAAADTATENYKNLLSTISGYEDALNSIKTLEEGIVEFYEAIETANEKAKELIDTYKLIEGQDYTYGKNGLIQLTNEGKENMTDKAEREMYEARWKELNARKNKVEYNQKEIENNFTNEILKNISQSNMKEEDKNSLIYNLYKDKDLAKSLLSLNKSINENSELICKNTEAIYVYNEEYSKYAAEWSKYQTQIEEYNNQIGEYLIKTYGSSELKTQYNNLNNSGQKSANKIVSANAENSEYEWTGLKKIVYWTAKLDYALGGILGGTTTDPDQLVEESRKKSSIKTSEQQLNNILDDSNYKHLNGNDDITAINSQRYAKDLALQLASDPKNIDWSLYTNEERQAAIKTTGVPGSIDINNLPEYDATKRSSEDIKNYNDELTAQASTLGTTTNAMRAYAVGVRESGEVQGESNRETAEAIGLSYKLNKAYNEEREIFSDNADGWEDYVKALKKGVSPSYAAADAAGNILDSLEDLGLVLSDDDLKSADTLDTITALFSGTEAEAEKAWDKLQKKSIANALISNFDIAKDKADSLAESINNLSEGDETTLGDLGLSEISDSLNKGKYSLEEFQNQLGTIGLAMGENEYNKIKDQLATIDATSSANLEKSLADANAAIADMGYEIKTEEAPASITTHKYKGQMPYVTPNGEVVNKDVNYEVTETSAEVIPYITMNGNAKVTKAASKKPSNFSSSTTTSKKSSSASKDNSQISKYESVEEKLTGIKDVIEDLEKEEDRLTGLDYIENVNKQLDASIDKLKTLKEGATIASADLVEYQGKLSKYGFQFDENGAITNYYDVYKAAQTKYNSNTSKYKNWYDEFKKVLEYYTGTVLSKYESYKDQIVDAIEEAQEKEIEALKKFFTEAQSFENYSETWSEFINKSLDENTGKYTVKVAYDFLQNAGTNGDITGLGAITSQMNKYLEYWETYKNTGTLTGTPYAGDTENGVEENMAGLTSDTQETLENFMEEYNKWQEKRDQIDEGYAQVINEVTEDVQDQLDLYGQISEQLKHDENLIKLIYGEDSYNQLANYLGKELDNYNKQIQVDRSMLEYWQEKLKYVAENLGKDSDSYKAIEEQIDNWQSQLNSDVETTIDLIKNKLINANADILKSFGETITGALGADGKWVNGLGLDYATQEWEMINKESEEYLDNINAAYGIQELENKIAQSSNDLSATANKKLNSAMDQELAKLREKDKLSQYDIDRANLKYELTLKQIALEEAQANKSKLRLRRDSQGNYTYQYTADEDQISSIQQEVDSLNNQLYNLDKDKYHENLQSIEELTQESLEKIEELYNDTTLTDEERAKKKLDIETYYGELINNLVNDNEYIKQNYYDSTADAISSWYEEEPQLLSQMVAEDGTILMDQLDSAWTSSYQNIVDNCSKMSDGFSSYLSELISKMSTNLTTANTEINTVLTNANINIGDIKEGTDSVVTSLNTEVLSVNDLTEAVKTSFDAVDPYVKKLGELKETLDKIKESAMNAGTALNTAFTNEKTTELNEYNNAVVGANTGTDTNTNANNDNNNDTAGTSGVKEPPEVGDYVTVKPGTKWYTNAYGGGGYGTAQNGYISLVNGSGSHRYHIKGGGWVRLEDLATYDTGGYTGDWTGVNGKLAVLHQKELILNKEDTQNILSSVSILRSILNPSALNGSNTLTSLNNSSENVNQNVTINAEFPNATSHTEIEEAFKNLVNMATMRINK